MLILNTHANNTHTNTKAANNTDSTKMTHANNTKAV